MRVLLVVHDGERGGSNRTVLSLLRHRPADVECACVFLAGGPVLDAVSELGVPVSLISAGRARHIWRAPVVIRSLRAELAAWHTDVVFAHVTKAHLYASPAAARARVPYLWWQQETRARKPLMHLVSSLLPAQAVICSAYWTAAEQRHRSQTAVHAIQLGIEMEPPPPRAHGAPPGEPPVIGVVGRLQRWKRVELALETLAELRRTGSDVRLRVIGGVNPGIDEDYDAELRERAAALGVADAVDFRGMVADVPSEIAELDVLLHLAELEPFGLAVVEAMAQEVPVVAVAEGGPLEIVRDGLDGFLAPADPVPLAACVRTLAENARLRAEMGARGAERAARAFAATRMSEQAWSLVAEVAGTAGRPAVSE